MLSLLFCFLFLTVTILSVRPSVRRVHWMWQNEIYKLVHTSTPCDRAMFVVSWGQLYLVLSLKVRNWLSVVKTSTAPLSKAQIWPIICRTWKRYEIGCKLVVITNLGNLGFPSVPNPNRWPWMTLNGAMAGIWRYFTEFGSFGSNYV